LHKSSERKPETVEDGEVVGDRRTVRVVLNMPLERTKSTDEEQHDADADVREYDAHPDLIRERIHEREHAGNVLDRFLYDNRYSLDSAKYYGGVAEW